MTTAKFLILKIYFKREWQKGRISEGISVIFKQRHFEKY